MASVAFLPKRSVSFFSKAVGSSSKPARSAERIRQRYPTRSESIKLKHPRRMGTFWYHLRPPAKVIQVSVVMLPSGRRMAMAD